MHMSIFEQFHQFMEKHLVSPEDKVMCEGHLMGLEGISSGDRMFLNGMLERRMQFRFSSENVGKFASTAEETPRCEMILREAVAREPPLPLDKITLREEVASATQVVMNSF